MIGVVLINHENWEVTIQQEKATNAENYCAN